MLDYVNQICPITRYYETQIFSWKAVALPNFLSEKTKQRGIEKMGKFKYLREAVKLIIELNLESQFAEIDKRIPAEYLLC